MGLLTHTTGLRGQVLWDESLDAAISQNHYSINAVSDVAILFYSVAADTPIGERRHLIVRTLLFEVFGPIWHITSAVEPATTLNFLQR